jgi:ribose 5-phosphate isomerase
MGMVKQMKFQNAALAAFCILLNKLLGLGTGQTTQISSPAGLPSNLQP